MPARIWACDLPVPSLVPAHPPSSGRRGVSLFSIEMAASQIKHLPQHALSEAKKLEICYLAVLLQVVVLDLIIQERNGSMGQAHAPATRRAR